MEYKDLIAAVLLSFVIERSLAVFFDITGVGNKLKLHGPTVSKRAPSFVGASAKGIIAAVVAISICAWADINVINEVIANATGEIPQSLPNLLGEVMTGLFIAGGSQGSVKLFQDILGFSKENRDLINKAREEEAKADEEKAKRNRMAAELETKRLETALVTAKNEERLASLRADTDKKLARIEREKSLDDAKRRAGKAVDPSLLISPADDYLRDVMDDWEEFAALRAELKASRAAHASAAASGPANN